MAEKFPKGRLRTDIDVKEPTGELAPLGVEDTGGEGVPSSFEQQPEPRKAEQVEPTEPPTSGATEPPLVDEFGNLLEDLPPDVRASYLKGGYRAATQEQIERYRFKQEHNAPVKAFGLGVLRGGTLGVSDIALTKSGLMTPESLKAYKEMSPWASGGGQLLGGFLPIAATEGAAAGLEGLGEAAVEEGGGVLGEGLAGKAEAEAVAQSGEAATQPVSAEAKAIRERFAQQLEEEGAPRYVPGEGEPAQVPSTPGATSAETPAAKAVQAAQTSAETPAAKATAESAAEDILSKEATKANPGTLGKFARGLLTDSVIGAEMAAGDQVSEYALGDDHALTAERLLPSMLGGALGAGLGGLGLRAAGEYVPQVVRGLQGRIDGARTALSDFIKGRAALAAGERGVSADALRMALEDPELAQSAQQLQLEREQAKGMRKDLGKDLHGRTQDLLENWDRSVEHFRQEVAPAEARNMLSGLNLEEVQDDSLMHLGLVRDNLEGALALDKNVSKQAMEEVRKLLSDAGERISNAEHPADVFQAAKDFRDELGRLSGWKGRLGQNPQPTRQAIGNLFRSMKEHLLDENVYGKMAGRQAEIDAALAPAVTAREQLMRDFGTRRGGQLVLDPDKAKAFLKQVAAGNGSLKGSAFDNFISTAQRLHDEMESSFNALPEAVSTDRSGLKAGEMRSLFDAARDAKVKGIRDAENIANRSPVGPATAFAQLQKVSPRSENLFGRRLPLLAAAHAVPGLGPMVGMGMAARDAYRAISHPAAAVKVLGRLAQVAEASKKAVALAGSAIASPTTRRLGTEVAGHLGAHAFSFSGRDHSGLSPAQATMEHRLDIRRELAKSPDQLSQEHAPLLRHAPTAGAALLQGRQRALMAIQAALPPERYDPTSLDLPEEPSQEEVSRFEDRANLVTDPVGSASRRVAEGTLTSQDVQVLQQVYPKLYGELVQSTVSSLGQLSVKERAQLTPDQLQGISTLVGRPLVGWLQPDTMQVLQGVGAPQQPQMQPTRGQKLSKAGTGRASVSSNVMTSVQTAQRTLDKRK